MARGGEGDEGGVDLLEVVESGRANFVPCKALERRVLDVRGANSNAAARKISSA